MSYSGSRSFRRKRKRQDPLAMLLAVVSVVGLPVLGFAAYKLLNRPPTTIITYEHVKADPIKVEKFQPDPPKKEPTAMAAARGPDTFGPGPSSSANLGGRLTSIPDAVDRIGEQLAKAITDTATHQVLVVWLFDQSASNDIARGEVVGRLDALYQGLAAAAKKVDEGKAPAVLSVIGAFGPNVEFLTKEPTDDAAAVKRAAEGIKSNTSHVENTFAAVQAVVENYSKYRLKGRYVSLVIVSDEAADDQQKIDEVLPTLKRYAIPVYCIGVMAPFGSVAGSNQNSEGRGADASEIRVHQGPESRFPEWIHLRYPDGGDANVAVDTELGPYTLARLCQETDGEYFALPQMGGGFGMGGGGYGWNEPPRGRKRRPAPMMSSSSALPRKYAPVYLPEQEVQAQLETNKAKKALVEASKLPPAEVLTNPTTMFSNADDVQRTRDLDKAQKPAARIIPGIDAYYNALKPGEADERKLAGEPRWQAGYDLAYGRAMAAKARADGYMSQLAVMKGGPKRKDPKPVQLVLEPTDEPSGNSVVDKLASKSRELLNRVIKEHPGTPWAVSAEHELQLPLGWKWDEQ